MSICIIHWHWVSSPPAWAHGIEKDSCVSSPSSLFSPATALRAAGFVPGQIHFACSPPPAGNVLLYPFPSSTRSPGQTRKDWRKHFLLQIAGHMPGSLVLGAESQAVRKTHEEGLIKRAAHEERHIRSFGVSKPFGNSTKKTSCHPPSLPGATRTGLRGSS